MQLMGWTVEHLEPDDISFVMDCGNANRIHVHIWTRNSFIVYSSIFIEQGDDDDIVFDAIVREAKLMKLGKRELMYHELRMYMTNVSSIAE